MPTKAITDESFEKDVIQSEKPTVVDFGLNGADLVYQLLIFRTDLR